MSSLLKLAIQCERAAKNLKENVSDVSVNYAEDLVFELGSVTPVDTSEAVSNWQTSISRKPSRAIGAFYPGDRGSTHGESARAAHDAARIKLKSRTQGKTIWVSNLASHIARLNAGSSSQAPEGFIETANDRVDERYRNKKIELVLND